MRHKTGRLPICKRTEPITGSSYGAQNRATKWSAARHMRTKLVPVMTQQDVGKRLGMTRQAVEQTELRALAKVISAFGMERAEWPE